MEEELRAAARLYAQKKRRAEKQRAVAEDARRAMNEAQAACDAAWSQWQSLTDQIWNESQDLQEA